MTEYKLAVKTLEAKFIISIIAQLTSIWLAGIKVIDGEQWVFFAISNIGAYGVLETVQQSIAARTKPQPDTGTEVPQ